MSMHPSPVLVADCQPASIGSTSAGSSILALDLGTTTGWASLIGGIIQSGTVSFRPSRYDGGGMRYLRFQHWLDTLFLSNDGLAAIYFEEVRRHVGTDAAHLYGLPACRRQRGRCDRHPALGDGDPGRCAVRWSPRGYGGQRRSPDDVKRDGWREQRVLAVSIDDARLTWPERELIRQLGEKLYGDRNQPKEARR